MSQSGENGQEFEPPSEVYPAAPLNAVAIECYFPTMLDAHARFGAFQRKHADYFTNVRVTNDEARDLRDTVLLINDSAGRGVAIALNFLSVITYEYDGGFASFESWARPLLEEALDVLGVARFTAVTFRYENVIDFGDARSVEEILHIQMPRHASAGAPPRDLYLEWKQPWPSGDVTVNIGAYSAPNPHMHLDISARRVGPLSREAVSVAIRESHRMGRLTFEEMITPAFRERLRSGKAPS